ncbi:radical sam domain protein : Radical SAM domain protein OS=Syntrophobacter fumaroxidans (strain DSM 10017 / MPOB) GN=Sfum_2032 PE=4 SV=1: Radical_SAM: Fer4_14: SPASM [Gemmata massiliana]|uniref:Radical SAM core domain-containing protein n=1 Tax=Gemmata massiliana TaxID=1210884 RepID=A0A6P2DEC7_9BACT|nr:radical SAM protein [Gemmata massiliana]VTS00229.1 radical sam domain protein : Radical SAM domain protein OS=Syntrophobacter fumaroxidans (strain DSM 10017 / MPOB) GN=Sfum_2032 PE=4 SV=1: Radical_SAM: Fer4_14: SPASM [Gemmata massiliana]
MRALLRPLARLARRLTGVKAHHLKIPYAWIPYHLYDDGTAWAPLTVTLELTYLCNLRCKMCSLVEGNMVTPQGQRQNPELREADGTLRREISTEEYLDIIRQIGRAGVKAVSLTGGEPTLRRDIATLVAAIKKYPIHLSLISNGSGKPEVYRELIDLGVDSITISVDGTREVHDHVRGREGSFDKAVRAVRTIIDAKKANSDRRPWLEVSCAVSALNQHDLENLVTWFEGYEIDMLNIGHLHYSTAERQAATERLVDGPIMHLKQPELPDRVVAVDTADLVERIARIRASRGTGKVPVKFMPELDADQIHRQYADPQFVHVNKCFHPWLATRIDPWGQMYPCWIDIRLGDVRKRGFMALWNSELYRKFRRNIREQKLLPKCATCPALTDKTWSSVPTLDRGLLQLGRRTLPIRKAVSTQREPVGVT